MNALQQFIQSRLATAVRPESQPSAAHPLPGVLDSMRGPAPQINPSMTMVERNANTERLRRLEGERAPLTHGIREIGRAAGVVVPGMLNPVSDLPNLIRGAYDQDVRSTAQADVNAYTSKASKASSSIPVDDASVRHVAESLKKVTPYGSIDYPKLAKTIRSQSDPTQPNMVTFGGFMRGVLKYLDVHNDEEISVPFFKAISDAYQRIKSGEHMNAPENAPPKAR